VTAAARSDVWAHRFLPALVATALVSCSTIPPTSPARAGVYPHSSADEALATSVYLALNDDPVYFYRHVEVTVDDGVASLSGYVWSADAIYRARQITRNVPGVTRVVTNHLELERNGFSNGRAR
jgi:hypothetical protein